MSSRRAVVTVIKRYGDEYISDSIITGMVSDEIKRIQAENYFMRKRLNDMYKDDLIEASFAYNIKPSTGMKRFMERLVGLVVLLNEERRQNRAH